jgi:hypothetical protein
LRPGRLELQISPALLAPGLDRIDHPLLIGQQGLGQIVRHGLREIEVDGGKTLRPLLCHRGRHEGAPIATLRNVTAVTETAHQLRPGTGRSGRIPAALFRLV